METHTLIFLHLVYIYIYISFSLPFVASWIPIRVVYYSMCRFVCESVCVLDSLSAFFSPLDFSTFIFSNQMTIPWGSVKWTFTLSYHLIVGRLWITIHSTEMDAFYFFEWLEWCIQSIKSDLSKYLAVGDMWYEGWQSSQFVEHHLLRHFTSQPTSLTSNTPLSYATTCIFDAASSWLYKRIDSEFSFGFFWGFQWSFNWIPGNVLHETSTLSTRMLWIFQALNFISVLNGLKLLKHYFSMTIFSPQTIYYRLVYPYHFNNCTALIQVMQENKCPIRKFYVVSRGKTLFCFTYLKVKSRGASLSTRKFGVWLCTLWMQTFTEVCSTSDYETGAKLTCNRIHFFLCWIKTNFLCCGEGGESLCKQIAIPKSPAYQIEWLVLTKR